MTTISPNEPEAEGIAAAIGHLVQEHASRLTAEREVAESVRVGVSDGTSEEPLYVRTAENEDWWKNPWLVSIGSGIIVALIVAIAAFG